MGSWSVFSEGDALYGEMLRDIAMASHSVRIESYILVADQIGTRFLSELAQAASRGVSVAMRVDHAGSFFTLPNAHIRGLRASGVDFRWSRRWTWRYPWRLNRRNHRKLLIVDESSAYLGGFNIHESSSLRVHGPSRWRDTHLRFDGPLVAAATAIFDACREQRGQPVSATEAIEGRRLIPNSTRSCRRVWRCAVNDAVRAARSRIWVTTPYFVPDHRLQAQLIRAARQGVDVRLLVPAKSDVVPAQWAARAAYSSLLEAGVRIFEYAPRVLHAKTMLVDHTWASLGTANIDYRSFFVNDEINLTDATGELNGVMERLFNRDLEESVEIRFAPWRRRPWTSWLTESIGWVMRRWL